ncbi:Lar family restriction alleviation protein [Phaeobacter inhibens]|uniref:Lar family restriction alleviation protein n=1 Tax=Phaeobacter inhibens TaxID=221822 RepID=UPI000C9C66D2
MADLVLKPCPFCGGPACHNDGGDSVYGRFWWSVGCTSCGISFTDREFWSHGDQSKLDPNYPPKECFGRWNQRAGDPQ